MPKLRTMLVYNTLSRSLEELKCENDNEVRIYSCGLTVYDYAHIGNLRKYIFDDLLVRTLLHFGYKVKHVLNITDVGHLSSDSDTGEDKIEQGAEREHKSAYEIAKFYENQFVEDLKALNMRMPDVMPRATEHIKEQIELVKTLEEKGYTYKIEDGIYFDTSRLEDYGKLTGQKREDLKPGARVEENKEKKNPADFALWKFSVPLSLRASYSSSLSRSEAKQSLSRRQMEWESPWAPPGARGKVMGFPAWHLECSAMSTKYLGQPFEIHTGGVDHIGVHHTNEIAQSEAAYDKPLASYWMHSDFLLEEGRKMAKSAGHFIRLQDIESKGYSPLDFRYLCLTAHYRKKLDFSWDSLESAHQSLKKLRETAQNVSFCHPERSRVDAAESKDLIGKFDDALADDLNSPKALSEVFAALEKGNLSKKTFEYIDEVLVLDLLKKAEIPEKVLKLADKRDEFRKKGDYGKADELRAKILELGFEVEDTKEGPKVLTR